MQETHTCIEKCLQSCHEGLKRSLINLTSLQSKERQQCFSQQFIALPSISPPTPSPLTPLWVHAKIPLALLMTCGSKKKRVAEQERHKINHLIYSFFIRVSRDRSITAGAVSSWLREQQKEKMYLDAVISFSAVLIHLPKS